MDLFGLKEEIDNKFLNSEQIMYGIACSKYKLPLVKNDKMEPNKELVAVFNSRHSALYCEELLTLGQIVCCFCISHDYKMVLFQKNDND